MEGFGLGLIVVVALVVIALALRRQRERAANLDIDDGSWLSKEPEEEPESIVPRAPVSQFHVHGTEARVTFDVPLAEEDDVVLNEILLDEAVEVVREKRKELPIDDVTEIVVFAGRDDVREVGRAQLPSPGELPPQIQAPMLSLTHIAKDPFAHQFESEQSLRPVTQVDVPGDELGPWRAELQVPEGLLRGMRARGIDPAAIDGPAFILALLEMFEYHLKPLSDPDSYMATKDGTKYFIRTEGHSAGSHPELDEAVVKRFVFEFSTSGAEWGLMVSDKYSPYMIHDVESREPRIRFITRERGQQFIDSMALG